ncbi:MAG: hypothetical protein QN174_01620 [Armatimonadota bacterium]|nr:hypothetical protein [Armatimonadota bacterium]MDR7422489.1 hypothetical protein [Armatimonadota bacterium]MDR7453443.1 hypothetical protein [Armatimonadota bacterium]MDR7457353.1 hypothetical protein [Armatimonadota bacterium]MDR7495645.1 hypothetical protein [Armatimonadota bacterium]
MRAWTLALAVLIVAVAALAPAGAQPGTRPPQPANYIIVPGHAVGDIQLGMTQQQVLNRLGMPDEISNDRGGDGGLNVYWIYPQGERTVLVISWTKRQNDAGGVDFIFTDAQNYVTSRGVAMGNSNFRDILQHYGAPERLQGGGRGSVMLYYEAQGIRFRVEGEGGRVTAITVVPRK